MRKMIQFVKDAVVFVAAVAVVALMLACLLLDGDDGLNPYE